MKMLSCSNTGKKSTWQIGYWELSREAVMTQHVSHPAVAMESIVAEMVRVYEHQIGILPLFFYSVTTTIIWFRIVSPQNMIDAQNQKDVK